LQYLVVLTQVAAGWFTSLQQLGNDGRKHRPKHVELTWNNKLIYIGQLVGYFHSCNTMHGFINVKVH